MAEKGVPETDPIGNQAGGHELKHQPSQTDPLSAGQSIGPMSTPSQDQTLIDFQGGDPNRPYVVGNLYGDHEHGSGGGAGKVKVGDIEIKPKTSHPWRRRLGGGLVILFLLGLIGAGVVLLPKVGPFNGGLLLGGQTAPTATAQAVPTATSGIAAQPTDTPPPACQVFAQGSANNVTPRVPDINLDGSGPATAPNQSSHIRYSRSPTGGSFIFSQVNRATIHDVGIGANYNGLTCAQLTGFNYGGGTVPFTIGEVFAVKTPGGHYAKVQITMVLGALPTVQWVTYKP